MKKYERIYGEVKERIISAQVREGEQLPTEAQYMEEFEVSRPTVAKALRRLEAEGYVARGPGMGTFVRAGVNTANRKKLFGLAFPETGHGEIFDPIMTGIAEQGTKNDFSLLWGSTKSPSGVFSIDELLSLMQDYVRRNVDGVFFAPLEGGEEAPAANREAVRLLDEAHIPVVLIDRDLFPFPKRSAYSLVAIDNVRAGYAVAEHYLLQGARRIDFVWLPYAGYTIELRIRGYQIALLDHGINPCREWIHYGDPESRDFVHDIIGRGGSNLICGNDETAAILMNTFRGCAVDVPGDVRVAAFDDVKYSRLISVPLTTIRQPVREIAQKAVREMIVAQNPTEEFSPETVIVRSELVVRDSSFIRQIDTGEIE